MKEKLQELSNIHDGTFFDFVVMAAKQPFEMGDSVTLWVTDYTKNDAFYPMLEHDGADGLYADPMGYGQTDGQRWVGPTGKMSLQVTCWEPHASAIRSRVAAGTYIRMRNVQIKFGRNGASLEGFLRGDMRNPSKVYIEVLDPMDDPDDIDPKLKELLRRKRDYVHAKKRPENAPAKEKESKKRKSENEAPKENSRTRRARRRAQLQPDEKSSEEDRTKLNPLGACSPIPCAIAGFFYMANSLAVVCEDMGVASVPVSSILEPVHHSISTPDGPVRVPLPFNNMKYRAIVRVVDFMPNTLEEFTYPRRPSEYGALSDCSESTDDEADPIDNSAQWEWRFKLLLEDASARAGPKPARVWAYVDNPCTQYLTNLDASEFVYPSLVACRGATDV